MPAGSLPGTVERLWKNGSFAEFRPDSNEGKRRTQVIDKVKSAVYAYTVFKNPVWAFCMMQMAYMTFSTPRTYRHLNRICLKTSD